MEIKYFSSAGISRLNICKKTPKVRDLGFLSKNQSDNFAAACAI